MLSEEIIEQAAKDHLEAEVNSKPGLPLSIKHPEMTLEDGYAIQKSWVNKKIAQGQKVVGYKIGYTSRAMQKALNIEEPDFGVLLDRQKAPPRLSNSYSILVRKACLFLWLIPLNRHVN